jgi:hypothetical protein
VTSPPRSSRSTTARGRLRQAHPPDRAHREARGPRPEAGARQAAPTRSARGAASASRPRSRSSPTATTSCAAARVGRRRVPLAVLPLDADRRADRRASCAADPAGAARPVEGHRGRRREHRAGRVRRAHHGRRARRRRDGEHRQRHHDRQRRADQLPDVTAHGTASWVAENGSYTASDETFGQASLSAYKDGTMVLVSEELARGLRVRPRVVPRQRARPADRRAREHRLLDRERLGQADRPLDDGHDRGVTAATGNTTTIPADNLFDLYHSVKVAYRRNAAFVDERRGGQGDPQAEGHHQPVPLAAGPAPPASRTRC